MNVCGTGFLLPVIQNDLDSTEGAVQWVSNSSTVRSAAVKTVQVNSAFNITWVRYLDSQTQYIIKADRDVRDVSHSLLDVLEMFTVLDGHISLDYLGTAYGHLQAPSCR